MKDLKNTLVIYKLQSHRAVEGFTILLKDISKQLGDVKFPPANARAKTHWGKHTGSYSEQKPAHPGIHFYTEHVACSTNKQTQFNKHLTLFVQAISITVMHISGFIWFSYLYSQWCLVA